MVEAVWSSARESGYCKKSLTVLGDREPVLCQKQLINILKKDKTCASKCEGVKMRG